MARGSFSGTSTPAQREAAKRYLAARHWRDAVIVRLRDLRLRDEEANGPAA